MIDRLRVGGMELADCVGIACKTFREGTVEIARACERLQRLGLNSDGIWVSLRTRRFTSGAFSTNAGLPNPP